MAISRAVVGTSPYAIRYSVQGNSDDNLQISAATLIGELAEGPLKQTLQKADADGDSAWTALGKADMAVTIAAGGNAISIAGGVPATVPQGAFTVVASSRGFTFFAAVGSDAVAGMLEIRLEHTTVR